MWWVISFVAISLYYKRNNIIEAFRNLISRDLEKEKSKKHIEIAKRYELIQILKENIGNVVTIRSDDLVYVYKNRITDDHRKLTGRILEVDNEWINIECNLNKYLNDNRSDQLIFRIDSINCFFINIEEHQICC